MKQINGVLNIYKEKGFTSHDVVNVVRKNMNRIKAGHTGTLDPDAEGVLPICLGKATKIADYLVSDEKEYTAEVVLGITTDTLDLSGTVLSEKEVTVTEAAVQKVVSSFVGTIMQTPPMYSAIKIQGQKLYELARKGVEVERKQREVQIYDIQIITPLNQNRFTSAVRCSKGTYSRSLCDDIGKVLGCGAVMGKLIRNRTGNFVLDNAITLGQMKEKIEQGTIAQWILPIDVVLDQYKKVVISENAEKYLYNGNQIHQRFVVPPATVLPDERVLVYDKSGRLIGIYTYIKSSCSLKPLTMFL